MTGVKITLISAALLSLYACGGGTSSSNDSDKGAQKQPPVSQTGVFLDSPIVNIGYKTETLEGVTNSLGEYNYIEGETVTFFIGDLELPSAPATGVVTPLELAGTNDTANSVVVNILRLLQTLDQDGEPDNGITITDTAKNTATQVDFSQSESDFESSAAVTTLIMNAGQESTMTSLVPASEAIAHFEESLTDNGIDFIANATITGSWLLPADAESDTGIPTVWTFSEDGTYFFIDSRSNDEISAERGDFTIDNSTGEITIFAVQDTELDNGPNNIESLIADVSGDVITFSVDGNDIDANRLKSDSLVGTWHNSIEEENYFLSIVFLADNTFILAEFDDEFTFDAERGSYSIDNNTNEITFSIEFDTGIDAGLSGFSNMRITAEASGDVVTLSFENDEQMLLERQ